MNRIVIHTAILISWISMLQSCRKRPAQESGHIKSYAAEYHSILLCAEKLDDGNVIMVSNYLGISLPGDLKKISPNGEVIWQKKLHANNTAVLKAIPIKGKGFLTYGYDNFSGTTLYLFLYDYSGNIIKTDSIKSSYNNWASNHSSIIQLNDGNIMLAQAYAEYPQGIVRVHMFNADMKRTKVRSVYTPSFYTMMQARTMCQTTDGSVQIAVTTQDNWDDVFNMHLYRFSQSGDFISSKRINNADTTESASNMISHGEGTIMVCSAMKGYNWGSNDDSQNSNGCMVDYNGYGGSESYVVSGRIHLRTVSSVLAPSGKQPVTGYSNNGLIQSIKRTTDGGYLLCGTVNQLGTSLVTSDTRIFLLRLDASLKTRWSRTIPTAFPAIGCNAIPTDDGGILIFGTQKSLGLKSNALVIKTDEHGNY